MKAIGVIPARWGSTRFEGKILAAIAGKPMIQHVWERAQKSKQLDDLLVATDDQRIKEVVESFGGKAVLTRRDHLSGSDRIAEAVENIDSDIVVNIQGDEPLIECGVIDDLITALLEDSKAVMATVVKKIERHEDIENPNVVKAVMDLQNNALYFSRSAVPYNRGNKQADYYKHLGIYAYQKSFLIKFKNLPVSKLEQAEQLEQLRVLEAGYCIKTVVTQMNTIGVDTKEDLLKVEEVLKRNG